MKSFWGSIGVTIVVWAAAFIIGGWATLAVVVILSILEVSLSFDNAVVNATVVRRMSRFWQRIFLSVGVIIAVFGMRFVLPILIVMATAGKSLPDVWNMALHDPDAYAAALVSAHPQIAAFGGIFLLMIGLDFFFEERETTWLTPLEKVFHKLGGIQGLSVIIALCVLVVAGTWLAPDHREMVLLSGVLGLVAYLAVNGLAGFFEGEGDEDDEELAGISGPASSARGAMGLVGKAAFFMFLYLELLDASFSFDGVIGAFAISTNIFVIAAGLAVGAMFIRSLTVYLVRNGVLEEYEYLEHGAHYAIVGLAVILFLSLKFEIGDVVTGLIGVAFIVAGFLTSVIRKRREPQEEPAV